MTLNYTISSEQMEELLLEPAAVKPKLEMVEAVTDLDGLSATLKALKELGMDLTGVPQSILNIIYTSGVAFADQSKMTKAEKQVWRNSIIWPVKDSKGRLVVDVKFKVKEGI